MSNFRGSQNEAHPNKSNTLITGIITILIVVVSIQVWFLYSSLNNALDDNFDIAVATFLGSLVLALVSFWLLRYLPDPRQPKATKTAYTAYRPTKKDS
jgi:peptidoglycan/LPS O-acetylase OafA/YrhL